MTSEAGVAFWKQMPRFVSQPRLVSGPIMAGGLSLSCDGSQLVAVVLEINAERSRWVPTLWTVPLARDGRPARLTNQVHAAASPCHLPDGSLVFVSTQSPTGGSPGAPGLWRRDPDGGLAPLAQRPGGLTSPIAARDSGSLVAVGQRLAGSTDENDAERRAQLAERGASAVLQSGMPLRDPFRDHDVEYPQLLLWETSGGADSAWRNLAPDAGKAMIKANPLTRVERSISFDGSRIAVMWGVAAPRGAFPYSVVIIDTVTGARHPIAPGDERLLTSPRISPDGRLVAALAIGDITPEQAPDCRLVVFDVTDLERPGVPVEAILGDLYPVEWTWTPDGQSLLVAGDLHGRGAVVVVDVGSGGIRHTLASDATYGCLVPTTDGSGLYAIRSTPHDAPEPVRLDLEPTAARPVPLPTPTPTPPLPPGRMDEVEAAIDGVSVRGYLCLPEGAGRDRRAPLMVWIHGGPLVSFNAWSWAACPWVFVAHGWAVLMPDPALSTGYGQPWIERGWPYDLARVWADIEALLDATSQRSDVDAERAACLGASFGGLMANWIAGHTDRFRAIVTHAGLYALDQHHATTEQAYRKNRWFGTPASHPDWYAQNSPDHAVENITTPMLITHGNGDLNVPVTEALRFFWDLCNRWTRPPEEMPHRLLRFRDENHFISRPANAEIWYQAVLAFCATHVLDEPTEQSPLI